MFQGFHGSAPGKTGLNVANPIACVLSGATMLQWLGKRHTDPRLTQAANHVRTATEAVLAKGCWLTPDLGGNGTTTDCAEAICALFEEI